MGNFHRTYDRVVESMDGALGAAQSGQYVEEVERAIDVCVESLRQETLHRRQVDIPYLKGWLMEQWHTETLKISAARWKEMGLGDFAGPLTVTCDDHNGHHSAYVQQWDGAKWVKASDWIEPIKDKVVPLIDTAAKDYATQNAGWPKRTEACDKSS